MFFRFFKQKTLRAKANPKFSQDFYVLIISMIPKKYRLKNKKAFDATYKNRHIVSDSLLAVYAGKLKKDEQQPTRYGFVVSKKYHKRAVKRNRIKRLLRECVRLAIKEEKISVCEKYMSLIFVPKEKTLGCKLCDIQNSFFKLIARLK